MTMERAFAHASGKRAIDARHALVHISAYSFGYAYIHLWTVAWSIPFAAAAAEAVSPRATVWSISRRFCTVKDLRGRDAEPFGLPSRCSSDTSALLASHDK